MLTALNHIDPQIADKNPKVKAALQEALVSLKGTKQYIELVRRHNITTENKTLLQMALAQPDSTLGIEAARLLLKSGGTPLIKQALDKGDDSTALAALKVIGHAGTKESLAMLKNIIQNKKAELAIRQNAVEILGHGWSESEQLLDMVKTGSLPKDLQATAAVALSENFRKDIRRQASEYFGNKTATGSALPSVSELEKRSGAVASGKQIFEKTCATCHQVGKTGNSFGPALTQIGSKLTKEALYTAIIQPDAGISFGYEGNVLKMKDGSTVAGIISSETGDAIEITQPGGVRAKYAKTDIVSRKQMDNSMMPSGLYQTMTEQELVDLVEFLYAQKGGKAVAGR